MPIVEITPTAEKPVPFNTEDEEPKTFVEEVAVAGNTAELQVALGAPLEVDESTAEKEKALIEDALKNKKVKNLRTPTVAFAASAFLKTYGQQIALDVAEARAAITYKLMELANCGDPRYELKALELLGKHSDIGLFTERSEITINYKDPTDLENAIKERVKRLLNGDVQDVTPIGANLDDQLGVAEIPEKEIGPLGQELLDETPEEVEPEDDDEQTSAR